MDYLRLFFVVDGTNVGVRTPYIQYVIGSISVTKT